MQPVSVHQNNGKTLGSIIRYWLPVAFWMAIVFSASADRQSYQHSSTIFEPLLHWLFPQMSAATVGEIHHLFRKMGHLTEYAILGWLVWRAVRRPMKNDPRPWNWAEAGLALSVVFAYAASDEFHQIFVPSRTPLVTDVLIDTTGGAAALLLLWVKSRISEGQNRQASVDSREN
jgi:VanZ family protein